MADFLLEIGCEEIPARMIDAASNELATRVGQLLAKESLGSPAGVSALSTPRRLSVMAPIAPTQQDIIEQLTGPSASIAFKDGQPTPAAQAFAKKAGVDVSRLQKINTPKGEYLAATVTKKGRPSSEVLAELLPKEINSIYWPKNMYWRKRGELFVRPVRWLVAMLDGEVIPLEFDGIRAGNQSRGHRILADRAVSISRPSSYIVALKDAKVLNRADRELQIRKALDAATRAIPGARWREDKELLETVVNLTEFPSAILGNFEREFLVLPEEILVTVMRDHQKYFAVEDANGKLLPHFLAVLNTDGDASDVIRHGHERVLRARFNDARFFWQADQEISLLDRVPLLKKVTFQKDLGSYYEKTIRVQCAASWLSETVRQNEIAIRPGIVHKAAYMAKADLTTELVKEFTELQGIVGGLYTHAQEIDTYLPEATRLAIGDTIYDHYKPESIEDSSPRSIEGAVLSIADKADSIAGMFALGLQPTGSKDPFALRRQANGIVKAISDYRLPFLLTDLMRDARARYQGSDAEKKFSADDKFSESTKTFFRERLEFFLRDVKGFSYDVVNAVLAVGENDVVDALRRAEAVKSVAAMPEFQAIGAACKRIRNILRQAGEKKIQPSTKFDALQASAPEEKQLAAFMERTLPSVEELRAQENYSDALLALSTAREPVDAFFDKVMVMVDDERIRANRLALLQTLLQQFSTIADFSEIVSDGKTS
ncbi:MAG: glycine--tRNA ligase subunit beta [Terriglobales bacterium]